VLAWCGAGALAVLALFLPWSRRGTGSRLSGHDLADLLLRQPDRSHAQLLAALSIYGLGLAGSLLVITAGLAGRGPAAIRELLVGLIVVGEAVALVRLHRPPARWGLGADAAVASAVVGLGALMADVRRRRVA